MSIELSENTQEPTTTGSTVTKTTSVKYDSMPEVVVKMKMAFTNAQLPNVLPSIIPVGYTAESLQADYAEVEALEVLMQKQRTETQEQLIESTRFEDSRKAIHQIYVKDRGLCRILFKNDVQAQVELDLRGNVSQAYGNWLKEVKGFYTRINNSERLKTEVAKISMKPADLEAQLNAIVALEAIKNNQKKETAEAQAATEARDLKFDEMYAKYATLVKYSKILLGNDQAIEALGIVVKR